MSTERALSFGAVSEDYDRLRPKPAPAALDWLPPEHASAAVDVGAGTGALTRRLGVLWTTIDREVDWVAALWRALRPGGTQAPGRHGPRALEILPGEGFGPVEGPHAVRVTQRFAREDLVGLAGTYSAMIVQPPDRRAAVLDEVRRALAADPRFERPVDVPVITRCYRATVHVPGTRSSNGSGSAR